MDRELESDLQPCSDVAMRVVKIDSRVGLLCPMSSEQFMVEAPPIFGQEKVCISRGCHSLDLV
jgi:hypothetical protein